MKDGIPSRKVGSHTLMFGDLNARISKEQLTKMRPLPGAWSAEQETNSKGEKLLEFCSTHDLKIVITLFKKSLSRLITWRHPRGSGAVIDYILSDPNTVWREMRASWGVSTGHHSDHAKLVGVILPPKGPGKKALDVESFLRKSLKRKSPGLRSKINTCLKSALGRSFLTSDNRLSHIDSIESFNRTLKELVCNEMSTRGYRFQNLRKKRVQTLSI